MKTRQSCEDGSEKMLFLHAQVRMLGCSALEAILELARRNDRKADSSEILEQLGAIGTSETVKTDAH